MVPALRTDETLKQLVDILTVNCGDLHQAARSVGMSPNAILKWVKDDPIAAEQIEEAQRVGWLGLESEAIRRGHHGVDEDVWFKGEKVGTKRTYSDGLLVKVMEARIPEYSKKGAETNVYNAPVQINNMPRADNYEQWLEMKKATDLSALPAPAPKEPIPEILQGEFIEVDEDRPLAHLKGLL